MPGAIVIGSDQVATLDDEQIGKPGNHANALAQLQKMRGREVVFHTALCVWDGRDGSHQLQDIQTVVKFRDLPDAELDAYLRIEQPYDCAGSAKNEALGIAILERIDSNDPTALTGLPLIPLTGMLRTIGITFFQQ
jgi:septum formation protein